MAAPKIKTAGNKSRTEAAPTKKPPPVPIYEKAKERFLKLTGFKAEDVLASNAKSYIFVVNNGGKYQMNRKGTVIKVLMGPLPPKTSAVTKE